MSIAILRVSDLLLPGEPLNPCEVLAGENRLSNGVNWVVSLRPYPPAFPRLRGGEFALVAAEHIARLDPPTTLASVISHLAARDAAGVAVRGNVDAASRDAAQALDLPLLQLPDDAPLPDIEQAIMRECALYQARREMVPSGGPLAWIDAALQGRIGKDADAQSALRKSGYDLSSPVCVALVSSVDDTGYALTERLDLALTGKGSGMAEGWVVKEYGPGAVVLFRAGSWETVAREAQSIDCACGASAQKALHQANESLAEAELSLLASERLFGRRPVRFIELGADRILLILYRDHPAELQSFVEVTLGPLLRNDERSANPLLPTVRAFVEHGGRLRETAAAIYVHRNTLAYRLGRAAEILKADLGEPHARLAIELALRAQSLVDQ